MSEKIHKRAITVSGRIHTLLNRWLGAENGVDSEPLGKRSHREMRSSPTQVENRTWRVGTMVLAGILSGATVDVVLNWEAFKAGIRGEARPEMIKWLKASR